MMLVPRIFEDDFMDMDNLFDDMFARSFGGYKGTQMMKTDVQEDGNNYQIEIDLPGYDKKDVTAELNNGYLTITAEKQEDKEEKDKKGAFIRKERYSGHCSRSFYVGDNITEADVQGKFENGVLKLLFPKEKNPKIEEKKQILIG